MPDPIQHFADAYYEKLYYFHLKKTGDPHMAEELTADTAMDILQALRAGTEPQHFSAWVWQIARNKYAQWAKAKRKRSDTFSGEDIAALDIADTARVDDALLHSEAMQLLRRELAFIASDYRNIIVAYYIQNRKIKDIAASLHLPVGTVKARLFRSRNLLKEGMDMARAFGALSYKPEQVGFMASGRFGTYGEPWTTIQPLLNKNTLLAAYRTPSTAEELAIELGVALPYMEDGLRILTESTLMRKNGNKYETAIFIISAKAQEAIHQHVKSIAPAFSEKIAALVAHEKNSREANGYWSEGYQPYDDAKWTLLMVMTDRVCSAVARKEQSAEKSQKPTGIHEREKRPNDGSWDFMGLEEYRFEERRFVGLHGSHYSPDLPWIDFGQFKFQYKNIQDKTPNQLSSEQAQALEAAAKGDTTGILQAVLDELVGLGHLTQDGGTYKPTFLVVRKDKLPAFTPDQQTEYDRLFKEAYDLAATHYHFCRETIHKEIPAFLRDDHYQIGVAVGNMFSLRWPVLENALDAGFVTYEEHDPRVMLGTFLNI